MPLVHSFSMTRRQIELLEHALRLVAKLSETGWDGIPAELRPSFARYMSKDLLDWLVASARSAAHRSHDRERRDRPRWRVRRR